VSYLSLFAHTGAHFRGFLECHDRAVCVSRQRASAKRTLTSPRHAGTPPHPAVSPPPHGSKMVKMIESAEEFATLKKGDKPVRSPRPDAASPFFFTAPGLKNLITTPRGTRSQHPHHPDRTRAISRGPSHRAESSVQARGTHRGTRAPADLASPRHPFSKAMQTLARFFYSIAPPRQCQSTYVI
jgi:hypothetical protein